MSLALSPPIADRLHLQPSCAGELRRASAKRFEDFGYRFHAGTISENRINKQAPSHPNLAEAGIERIRLSVRVDEQEKLRADMAQAMAAHKISQARLAEMVGLTSQSAVSNILKGKRDVSATEAAAIRRALGIEEGPPVREIPLIGLASAGAWQEAVIMPTRKRLIPARLAGNRAFAVEIFGDSMDKLLPEGGWAVVDPDQTHLYTGKVYLIANADEETTVKRYCGEPARFEPVSNNEMHEPLMLSEVRYRVVGRIVSYGNDQGL